MTKRSLRRTVHSTHHAQFEPHHKFETRLSLPNAAGFTSDVAVGGDGVRPATCFPPSVTSPPDRNKPSESGPPRSVSIVLPLPSTSGTGGGALPGSSNTPAGFSATAGSSGPRISFPSNSAVPGRTSGSSDVALPPRFGGVSDEQDPATALAVPSPTVLRDPCLACSAVDREPDPDPAAETSAAEYGTIDESGKESWRAEGALNTGPLRTDSSGGGSLAATATAKPTPSHFRRRRRTTMMTAAARSSAPMTMPAMAPPLRPEEGEDEPPSEPVEPELESLGGIATMCCWAPWFQAQAETLKTLRS